MAYHGGGTKTNKETNQGQNTNRSANVVQNNTARSNVVQNNDGRFVQRQSVETQEEIERNSQIEEMVQQMMTAGASAESMYQQTQAAQQQTQEETPIELSGTVFMPSPSSNTWVIQNVNGDSNLIEAGQNITLIQQGASQNFVIQSISGNTIILDESVPNQNIGSTLNFLITIEPSEETQEMEEEEPPQLPAPPIPPDDPRFDVTQRLYPGMNFRTFYGLESYRDILEDFIEENNINLNEWQDYWPSSPSDYRQAVPVASQTRNFLINNIFQGLPLTKISVLNDDGTTGKFFQPADPSMPGMPDLPVNINMRLDVIQSGNTYVIEMGDDQPYYDVTYKGLEPPFIPRRYETLPFEEVPASLPNAYQNRYQNEWSPEFENVDIPENQFCATCKFYEPDGSYCNKWNAKVRLAYWCAAWGQLEYPEAPSNQFTQFLRTRDASNASTNIPLYNFFHDRVKFPADDMTYPPELHNEPNLNNFLAPLDSLFANYGAVLIGDYLRRVIDSGNAFDYGDSDLDLIFPTPGLFIQAIEFINGGGLNANFSKDISHDLRVQAKASYLLTRRSSSNLEPYYPNQLRINLLGRWFGSVTNVISQLLFTNTKYAYTPKFNNQSTHAVWFDVRTTPLRVKGEFNIDILKQSTMDRFLKLANDPTREVKLNQESSFKFLSWIARRAPYHPEIQELYNIMLNAEEYSVNNQEFISALNNCLNLELPDEPEPANMPLNSNIKDVQPPNNFWERSSEQNGDGDGEGDSGGSTEEDGGGY